MTDSRAAKRYAHALFTTAQKYEIVSSVEEDLAGIAHLLEVDARFRGFMLNPSVGREEKIEVAEKLFSDRVTALTMQLFRLLLGKRRESEFEAIREAFVELRREQQSIMHLVVRSAQPLDDAQRKAILDGLAERSGKTFEAEFQVDPHLIGGVQVEYGDYRLDGTLRGALARLREQLRYDLLKQS